MRWKREDLAWAAGLIEGEGCIIESAHKNISGVRGGRSAWYLTVQMTDEDVLRRLAAVIGFGRVSGPYTNRGDGKKDYKPVWSWNIASRAQVYAALVALWPRLGARRREKTREALLALPPVLRAPWRQRECRRGHDRTLPGAVSISGNCLRCQKERPV